VRNILCNQAQKQASAKGILGRGGETQRQAGSGPVKARRTESVEATGNLDGCQWNRVVRIMQVIKRNASHKEIPEVDLWLCVIRQAIQDLNNRHRSDAIWFFNSPSFADVCDYIGCDPSYVLKVMEIGGIGLQGTERRHAKTLPRNASKRNKSGVTGVCFSNNHQKWKAYIYSNQKSIDLGLFHDKQDAIDARKNAELIYRRQAI
jgi:hypothetical protein